MLLGGQIAAYHEQRLSLLLERPYATRRLSSGEGFGCPAAGSRDTSTRLAPLGGGRPPYPATAVAFAAVTMRS